MTETTPPASQPPARIFAAAFFALIAAGFIAGNVIGLLQKDRSHVFSLPSFMPAANAQPETWTPTWRLAEAIVGYEDNLNREFVSVDLLQPMVQRALVMAGVGNEQVILGREGTLFLHESLDYVLDFDRAEAEEPRAQAIIDIVVEYKQRLLRRGIDLVVVPIPGKEQMEPQRLTARAPCDPATPVRPAAAQRILDALRQKGVDVFDPAAQLAGCDAPTYLATDTHWTPNAMETVAGALAEHLRGTYGIEAAAPLPPRTVETRAAEGDLAVMLRAPVPGRPAEEAVEVQRVTLSDGLPWVSTDGAPVVLMGDSFVNIFGSDSLEWGHAAGLGAQLSWALEQPVTVVARNGDGVHAARQDLIRYERETAGLANAEVIVWAFAERSFLTGRWEEVAVPPRATVQDLAPPPIGPLSVLEVSEYPPDISQEPYGDKFYAVLARPAGDDAGEVVVAVPIYQDYSLIADNRLEPGDMFDATLVRFQDLPAALKNHAVYDSIDRADLDLFAAVKGFE